MYTYCNGTECFETKAVSSCKRPKEHSVGVAPHEAYACWHTP